LILRVQRCLILFGPALIFSAVFRLANAASDPFPD
jgi:hypothetical protein